MKCKTIQLFVCAIAISLYSIGCSTETESKLENAVAKKVVISSKKISSKETKNKKLKKETSLFVGRLLSKKEVRDEVLMRMKEVSEDGELVSFGYLLGKNKGLRKKESGKEASKLSRKNSLFSQALKNELANNIGEYPTIGGLIALKKETSITSRLAEESDPFTDENLQIYSPYNEMNETPEASYETYYISEEMEDGSPTNSGFYFNGLTQRAIFKMDNDLIDTNPSFIISTIDECDIVGGTCETVELFAAAMPPPLATGATLLTYSVNHNDIPDQDIITTRIPMIKINGTGWLQFGGTHQKFRVFRGGVDSGVTQNPDGTITVTGKGFQIGEDFKTKRRNARKENWINFDREFDVDWNQSENSHQIMVFSLHHWRGTAEGSGGIKYGYKYNIATGVWEGTIEPTGGTTVKVSSGSSIFRANSELSRRQVLSTITGAGSTGKTQNDGGIEYNVKTVGIVDYYFKHWYTDL